MFHHLVVFPYYRPYSKNSQLHDCQFLVIDLTWYNWDFLEIISSCVTNEHTIPKIWSVNVKKECNSIVPKAQSDKSFALDHFHAQMSDNLCHLFLLRVFHRKSSKFVAKPCLSFSIASSSQNCFFDWHYSYVMIIFSADLCFLYSYHIEIFKEWNFYK